MACRPARRTHADRRWQWTIYADFRPTGVLTFVPVNETIFFASGNASAAAVPPPRSPLEAWQSQLPPTALRPHTGAFARTVAVHAAHTLDSPCC